MATTSASATAASAAATVITKMAKTWPSSGRGDSTKREKPTNVRLTAFSISSMPISTATAFRFDSVTYRPMAKRTAPTMSTCSRSTRASSSGSGISVLPHQHDGADHRRYQQHRGDLERQHERGQQRLADGGRRAVEWPSARLAPVGFQHDERQACDDQAREQ